MSTGTAPPPGSAGPAAAREIKLISHSTLFYWWPVWAFGFFMAVWTAVENNRLAVVPPDAKLRTGAKLDGGRQQFSLDSSAQEAAQLPKPLRQAVQTSDAGETDVNPPFPVRVSGHAWLGTLFLLVLAIVIVITNVPLRGLWSFLSIMGVVVIALLITLFHGWDELFERVAALRVYINLAGYLLISVIVFGLWLSATFVFDRRQYIIFTPGQIRVCEHVGDSVRVYDTVGMTFEKQRDDLFRHYILGFGSGDLIVRTSGAERHEIKFPNVLGIGWKLQSIEEMLREKATVVK